MPVYQIFVDRIRENIIETDLKDYFETFGRVIDVKLFLNSLEVIGYAFVTFENYDSIIKIRGKCLFCLKNIIIVVIFLLIRTIFTQNQRQSSRNR